MCIVKMNDTALTQEEFGTWGYGCCCTHVCHVVATVVAQLGHRKMTHWRLCMGCK